MSININPKRAIINSKKKLIETWSLFMIKVDCLMHISKFQLYYPRTKRVTGSLGHQRPTKAGPKACFRFARV